MKLYNMAITHLFALSLFAYSLEVAASQIMQPSQMPESLSLGNSLLSNIQQQNGREMLDEGYKKSLEGFRSEQLARQQRRAELLQQQELEQRKAVEETNKKLEEQERLAAEQKRKKDAVDLLALSRILESSGQFDAALDGYRCAAELGNTQAALCFDNLRGNLSCAQVIYSFALQHERSGRMNIAIELYQRAAERGNFHAAARLKALQESYAKQCEATQKNNKSVTTISVRN